MRRAAAVLTASLFLSLTVGAQDADTVLLKNDNQKFTIVSQIDDPAEASAFLAILQVNEPARRLDIARRFVEKYPQSWLLSQAYDLSARSAIDLGKYEDALSDGGFSLRLLPENPSLLVLMANVEAQRKDFRRAIDHAGDALEYLNQIERAPNMTKNEWESIRPQLKASAYFARARAEASSGIAAGSGKLLSNSLSDLNYAAAWNQDDPEIFYLRAIVEIQLGHKTAAASDLTFAAGSPVLGDKAAAILLRLNDMPLDLPARTIDLNLRRETSARPDEQALEAGYAGPAACRGCHEKEYSAWRQTGMARMLQPYASQNVAGDFSPSTQYNEEAEKKNIVIRLGRSVRPYFELFNLGTWNRYYVDYTIGSKWQQAYATKLPDGQLQVLPIEYNLLQKKWVNYWKILDPPGSLRAKIDEFPKLLAATNYQQNCAICHTSQLKANLRGDLAASSSLEQATYLEPGIDCEMCHGPAALHAKQVNRSTPLDFRKVSNRDGVRVCAQCHRQSAVREIGENGEMNYSTKEQFIPATWVRPYDAFSRKAFYKDGRFRETTFIVEAFTRSACYRRGTAQCATCHSPHLGDFANNLTSLKSHSDPNEMCLGCHSEFRNRVAEHSRHSAASEAGQCLTCHMPRIVNALLFKARSHQIEIPSADLTGRFGQQESPNVCQTCHKEKDAVWAKEQLAAWPH